MSKLGDGPLLEHGPLIEFLQQFTMCVQKRQTQACTIQGGMCCIKRGEGFKVSLVAFTA